MSRGVKLSEIGGSYTIQGGIVGAEGVATGIAVRPDQQSIEEILTHLDSLASHQEDYQKQRQLIPEGTLNRGGKTAADFRPGPGGIGITMAQTAIVVAEGVDVEHNEILFHPRIVGIIAEKGGATSHGVVVARDRNIPIIVNIPEAKRIIPGDILRMDAASGIIAVNGGDPNFVATDAQQAAEPIYGFVGSRGRGLIEEIQAGSEGAIAIHTKLAMQGMEEGGFDPSDTGMGVIYEGGKVQLFQYPSDQDRMIEGLNQTYPTTEIE